ncbi:MAG: hypothetical protein ACR5KX_01430 [Wolbachia sp.]
MKYAIYRKRYKTASYLAFTISHKDQRHIGEYKKFLDHVEAFDESGKSLGIIFETSSPFETVTQMQELIY